MATRIVDSPETTLQIGKILRYRDLHVIKWMFTAEVSVVKSQCIFPWVDLESVTQKIFNVAEIQVTKIVTMILETGKRNWCNFHTL